jgi:hypothetical protein
MVLRSGGEFQCGSAGSPARSLGAHLQQNRRYATNRATNTWPPTPRCAPTSRDRYAPCPELRNRHPLWGKPSLYRCSRLQPPVRGVKIEGVTNAERPASIRIGRVAAELKMRRRRLDAYQRGPDWPGKEPAWRWELSRYDQFLLLAASMLDVAVPEHDGPCWHPSSGPSSRIVCPKPASTCGHRG